MKSLFITLNPAVHRVVQHADEPNTGATSSRFAVQTKLHYALKKKKNKTHAPGNGSIYVGDNYLVIPVPEVDGALTATGSLVLSGDAEHDIVRPVLQLKRQLGNLVKGVKIHEKPLRKEENCVIAAPFGLVRWIFTAAILLKLVTHSFMLLF